MQTQFEVATIDISQPLTAGGRTVPQSYPVGFSSGHAALDDGSGYVDDVEGELVSVPSGKYLYHQGGNGYATVSIAVDNYQQINDLIPKLQTRHVGGEVMSLRWNGSSTTYENFLGHLVGVKADSFTVSTDRQWYMVERPHFERSTWLADGYFLADPTDGAYAEITQDGETITTSCWYGQKIPAGWPITATSGVIVTTSAGLYSFVVRSLRWDDYAHANADALTVTAEYYDTSAGADTNIVQKISVRVADTGGSAFYNKTRTITTTNAGTTDVVSGSGTPHYISLNIATAAVPASASSGDLEAAAKAILPISVRRYSYERMATISYGGGW
jgi:hypothetical protein